MQESLRRRVGVADELDVQPWLTAGRTVASTQERVAAPTATTVVMLRSDRSPNWVSKKLSVALLGGCGVSYRPIRSSSR